MSDKRIVLLVFAVLVTILVWALVSNARRARWSRQVTNDSMELTRSHMARSAQHMERTETLLQAALEVQRELLAALRQQRV